MSFNIRCDMGYDGADNWVHREHLVYEQIRSEAPHLLALQEVLPTQRQGLAENLPEYVCVGRGRQRGGHGEQCTIGVHRDLQLLERGMFWLSEEPDLEASVGWDACLTRVCAWVRVKVGEREFHFANTHFDHVGCQARAESARLMVKRLGVHPAIVVGDFNCLCGTEPIVELERAWRDAHQGSTETTYQEFGRLPDGPKIDYIFVDPEFPVLSAEILSASEGPFSSDHFPVTATIEV